jgi:hypothetical protein
LSTIHTGAQPGAYQTWSQPGVYKRPARGIPVVGKTKNTKVEPTRAGLKGVKTEGLPKNGKTGT